MDTIEQSTMQLIEAFIPFVTSLGYDISGPLAVMGVLVLILAMAFARVDPRD